MTVEQGSSYVEAGATSRWWLKLCTTSGTVDDSTIGEYTVTYSATDAAGNTGTATRTVNVVDKTAPVITIIGDNPVTVEQGSSYVDAGATADGGETVTTIGSVDTSTVGTYYIDYEATDEAGNDGFAYRRVDVVAATPPVITIIGDNPVTVEQGSSYVDAGATADGGETVTTIGSVDTSTVGTYYIDYEATDEAGNDGFAYRRVDVVAATPPVITIIGDNPVTVEQGSSYVDAGATADGGETVTTSGTVDESTIGEYTITYSATDSAGNTGTATRTVNVVNTNNSNAPVFISTATPTIDENTTAVTTLETTDDDANSSVTYSITGGADATSFAVEQATGVLTLKDKPDFESGKTSYAVTVTANDGVNSTPQDITVTINNLNDELPIITSPTQFVFEVPENFPLQTKIPGTDIIGYDPDGNEIIACSVAVLDGLGNKEGVSIGDAYLEGGSCYLEFGEEAVIDYESDVKQYRTLVAIYEEGYLGQSYPVTFTINITDVNEAPTITSTTTTFSAAENQTVIPGATITAIDVDAGDTLTFSVLSDVLTIDPDTGVLSFKAGEAPDFETTTEAITATVTVTDADGLFDTEEVTVTVTDVNDNAPVFTDGATLAVNFEENSTDPVTTLAATDLDAGDIVSYTLEGADAGSFNLADGVLTFKTAPDFETKSSYSITAVASDSVNEVSQAITVTVNNLNDERPIITSPTQFVFEVPENFPLQTKIPGIDITGYDPDGNKLRSCQQSNPDGLTPNTGLMVASQLPMSATQTCDLLFGSQANTDYESGPKSFKIEVAILDKNNPVTGRTGNNNVSDTQLITVNITDVNDNPPVFADVNYDITIVENTKGPTLLETTDADTGSTVTYSLSGADVDNFEIVNNTLALKEAADFETKSSYAVTVTATDNDGVNSTDQAVTYTITDANDNAPRFELLGSEIEIEENNIRCDHTNYN